MAGACTWLVCRGIRRKVTVVTASLPPENHYGHTKKLRFLLDEIARYRAPLEREVSLLDFGCGNGSAVSQYLIGEGIDYCGVDIHGPSLEYARGHYASPTAQFLDHIPSGKCFDIIVYADVLEHVPDPEELLRAHADHLAPNGVILAAVPNGYGPFEMENRIDDWLALSHLMAAASRTKRRLFGQMPAGAPVALPYNHESGHLIFFTEASLRRTVVNAGYEITRFAHGAFMGASVSGVLLARSERLKAWNAQVADRLPAWAVSTWYMTLQRSLRRE